MIHSEKIKQHFDSLASRRRSFRKRGAYYHKELEGYLNFLIEKTGSVLEIGCGTGETLANINSTQKKGIDISTEMIEKANEQFKNIEFEAKGSDELTSDDDNFDYILLLNTIGYFDDIQSSLENLQKISTERTRLIIVYFNYLWKPLLLLAEKLGLRMPGAERHWLPVSDIENLLKLAGFELIKYERRMLLPFYIPLVSAFCNKILSNLPIFRSLTLNTILVARSVKKKPEPQPGVSVIIPCRNERGNVENAVNRTPDMGSHTELIFVEGNSHDNTYEECLRIQEAYPEKDIKVFRQPGKGKADAVYLGFDEASEDILMILDGDLTVPPEDLPKFYNAISSGQGEFINGSRLVYDMEKEAMRPLNLLGNKFFSVAFSYLLSQRLRDTLCGTKVIRKEDYKLLKANRSYFGDFDPFGDFDLLFGASKLNLKIQEIPIRYRSREYGETQISRFKHGILLLRMVAFATRKLKFI